MIGSADAQDFGGTAAQEQRESSKFQLKKLPVQSHASMCSGLLKYIEETLALVQPLEKGLQIIVVGGLELCIGAPMERPCHDPCPSSRIEGRNAKDGLCHVGSV